MRSMKYVSLQQRCDERDARRGPHTFHIACGGPRASFGSEARLVRADVDAGRSTSRTRAGASVAESSDTGAAGGANVVERLQCSQAWPGCGAPWPGWPAGAAVTLWQMTVSGSPKDAAAAAGLRPVNSTCRATS